jgi:phosphoserine phosphatase RsbU/P
MHAKTPIEAKPATSGMDDYLSSIIHSWSKTLTTLGFTLIPIFFILDYFMMPSVHLTRFAAYRLITTVILVLQHLVVRRTVHSRYSFLHGYFFTFVASVMIAMMTTHLGGFDSTYYAGLNLVMIAVNLMLPWRAVHSVVNSAIVIVIYIVTNLIFPSPVPVSPVLVNNLYFLAATAVISVAINSVKEGLIREEFSSRKDLQAARDSLWSEIAVAKRIQTALLPKLVLPGYQIAATMLPAEEIGGDYYDVIQNAAGEVWITVGDVSGHGVESGLIMMMTQTSIATAVSEKGGLSPSAVLHQVNTVVTENIARLGTNRYMTVSALVLRGENLVFAGKHQDILIWRQSTNSVEVIPTEGTWLGVVRELAPHLKDRTVPFYVGDVVLLFTDGVTEATNREGDMYGERNLEQALQRHARLGPDELVKHVTQDVRDFIDQQGDDLTLLAFQRTSATTFSMHKGT